jgi:hypothetical protein
MTKVLQHGIIKAVKAGKRSYNGFKMSVWDEFCLVVALALKRVAPKEPISSKAC